MANYKFIKPYTTRIVVGGIVGTMVETYEVGSILPLVNKNSDSLELRIKSEPISTMADIFKDNMYYQTTIIVPKEYVEETNQDVIIKQSSTVNQLSGDDKPTVDKVIDKNSSKNIYGLHKNYLAVGALAAAGAFYFSNRNGNSKLISSSYSASALFLGVGLFFLIFDKKEGEWGRGLITIPTIGIGIIIGGATAFINRK